MMKLVTGLLAVVMLLCWTSTADSAVIIIKYRPIGDGDDGSGQEDEEGNTVSGPTLHVPLPTLNTPKPKSPNPGPPPKGGPAPSPVLGSGSDDADGEQGDGTTGSSVIGPPRGGGDGLKALRQALGSDEAAPTDEELDEELAGGCGGADPDPTGALGILALVGALRLRRRSR